MSEKKPPLWHSVLSHSVLVVWKPEYNLGIAIIDEQHRGIVSTINSLFYAMQHEHGHKLLGPIIDMVNDYTQTHFDLEEDFLEHCNYSELDRHRELHGELMETLKKVGRKSLLQQEPLQFLDFLKKWWIDHICNEDMAFRNYLKESGMLTGN
jgi:hemerythrin-like metal-binding protein